MILELADIRIQPGKGAEFDAAIVKGVETVIAKAKGFKGYKVNREVLVGEIKDKFDNYPMHLNLQQQGQFAIGYYHQRKALFPAKAKPEAIQE